MQVFHICAVWHHLEQTLQLGSSRLGIRAKLVPFEKYEQKSDREVRRKYEINPQHHSKLTRVPSLLKLQQQKPISLH